MKVFDRTANGEMPPKKKARPDATQKSAYLGDLSALLFRHDTSRIASQGRTVERRMNRFEYENAVRDLLQAPWLDLKEILPEVLRKQAEIEEFKRSFPFVVKS